MTASRRPHPRLRVALVLAAVLLGLMTAMRGAFWLLFHATDRPAPPADLLRSFYLGFKYDLRLTLLLVLPFLALGKIRGLDPVRSTHALRLWCRHFSLVVVVLLVVYVFDIGHYAYLETRLDASALRFLDTPLISGRMLWESYPVGWGALGIVLLGVLAHVGLRRWLPRALEGSAPPARRRRAAVVTAASFVFVAGLYGKASWYPLRWSDAFFTTHRFASDLALNPVLYFTDTLGTFEEEEYDREALDERYERVAGYLGVDDPDARTLTFARRVRPTPVIDGRPNVVLILMESFAAQSTGAFGNPLDPSPNFDRIARDGLLWRRFYTPEVGTARGVFATLTGIPDTVTKRTASRNPKIVDQYTIPAALEGYDKHYFLGGSANWANIRGLFANNIEDLHIHEEGDYPDSPRVDVWGISDLHLFEEANKVLRTVEQPFFAFIHLSGNHGPFTIPEDRRGFETRTATDAELAEAGFSSLAQYNSFRFLDHALGFYLRTAEKEPYFENTVFFMLGDNGAIGRVPGLPKAEEVFELGRFHTPFLVWGPRLNTSGRVFESPATQMDVMPTIAGAIGADVWNTTLGRNLLDPRFEHFAFIHTRRGLTTRIGLLSEDYYSIVDLDGSNAGLHDYHADDPSVNLASAEPRLLEEMTELGRGLYQASKWMMYHNGRSTHLP